MYCVYPPTEDTRVFSWGRADYGQLGVGDEVVLQGFCSEPTEVKNVRGAKQVHDSRHGLQTIVTETMLFNNL